MQDTEFGKRFTELMESRNISNTYITEQAGISKNNVGNYKNGQIPNATILYKLSQIFGVTMEYLLVGKEAKDLTPDEQQLVDYYRQADERGKRSILRMAQAESKEETSSTSGIG